MDNSNTINTLTAEEAAGRWCPLVRRYGGEGGGHNVMPTGGGEKRVGIAHCVADGCMFWRWSGPVPAHAMPRKGYCGAAGKPQ